jgi:O-acetyl-ADP-ribose deacetylase (regulator of RNase III)
MTLTFKKGDMFSEPAQALVNTVNCVGVMGKGVALEFKKRWPENFKAYKRICDTKALSPGQVFIFDTNELFATDGPRYLVNFPTKDHWSSKSKISYVEDGLDALSKAIKEYKISSISIPPLGCGNGGLDWADVKPMIVSKLGELENVEVVVFSPKDAVDEPEHVHSTLNMTFERAILLKSLGDLEGYFDGSFDRISLQKIVYFLQAFGVKFQLKFARNLHGPYSEKLRKAFLALENHRMISGFLDEDRQSHVTPSGYAIAAEYLQKIDEQTGDEIIDLLGKLIQGYESPYGLELLSSVHWLASHERQPSIEKIIEAMKNWNENKRNSFKEDAIRAAYRRLHEDQVLN